MTGVDVSIHDKLVSVSGAVEPVDVVRAINEAGYDVADVPGHPKTRQG